MVEVDVFAWLVQYHVDTNLATILPYTHEGKVQLPHPHKSPREGKENQWASGCLVISDGRTLADRLVRDDIILDQTVPLFQPVKEYGAFQEFLQRHEEIDGAFVYDGHTQRMARVAKFNNDTPALKEVRSRALELIPPYFVFEHQREFNWRDYDDLIGTKTDLAILAPVAYSRPDSQVHAYQIKRTGYGELGLGKVTHFDQEGLREEFFLSYDPHSCGPFIDEKKRIVGVHRTYENRDSKVQIKSENFWDKGYTEELRKVV